MNEPKPIDVKAEAPLTIRHWFLQTSLTTIFVCAILFGMMVLFLPDGIIGTGHDPAISEHQEYRDTQALHARLTALEQQLQQNQAVPQTQNTAVSATPDLVATDTVSHAEKLERTTQAAQEYEDRIREMQEQAAQDNQVSRMIFGIMQLKNAYLNDGSLQDGITVLKDSIKDENLQDKLAQLDTIIKDHMPTRQELLLQIQALKESNIAEYAHIAQQPQAPEQNQTQQTDTTNNATGNIASDWTNALKSRASALVNEFVTVRPTANVQQASLLDRMAMAVQSADYATAAKLAETLPENPKTKILLLKLQTRAKAQNLVHGVVSGVTNMVSNPNSRGALY